MGRPSKITAKHVNDAEVARRLGLTMELTADYIGVDRATVYLWRSRGQRGDRHPEDLWRRFYDALKRGTAQGAALAAAQVQKAARGGQWQAAAWQLERMHGYRANSSPEEPPPEDATATPEEAEAAIVKTLLQRPDLMVEVLRTNPGLLPLLQSQLNREE